LFLRWLPFYSEYEVYRRETAKGDTSAGTALNTGKYPDYKKISVSGDGSLAYFVATDHDYGVFHTDGSGYTLAYQPGSLWSLAVTPDGKRFAGVLLDAFGQPTKNLFLYDNTTSTSKVIPLYAPSNDGKPLDIIQYADTMDFTSDGRFLIYDAFAQVSTNAMTSAIPAWGKPGIICSLSRCAITRRAFPPTKPLTCFPGIRTR
jgi:hypothetical protein